MPTEFEFQLANNDCESAAALFTLALQRREKLRIPEAPAAASPLGARPPMTFGTDAGYQTSRVFELAHENVPEEEAFNEAAPCTAMGLTEVACDEPLVRLAPGPWISLGRYLNYEGWEERKRFLELDGAIAACGGVKRGRRVNAAHRLAA